MLSIQRRCAEFGRELLRTADLDPLYTMLVSADLGHDLLGRFLLAYGMFYHAGTAAQIVSQHQIFFWDYCTKALPSAPRGTERRHYRGDAAAKSLTDLMRTGSPEKVLSKMYPGDKPTLRFPEVTAGVRQFAGFGVWIAFKMADIADRTGYRRVDFEDCELSLYRDPVKGAALWRYGDQEAPITAREVNDVVDEVRLAVGADEPAPPLYDRPINVQEVETILCKFKSHYNGHYPPGKDTHEILHGLAANTSEVGRRLAQCPLL